jgi:hypothetical protein
MSYGPICTHENKRTATQHVTEHYIDRDSCADCGEPIETRRRNPAAARQPDAADLANRLERVLDERDALREAARAAYALFGSLDFLTPHEREVKAALAAALERP